MDRALAGTLILAAGFAPWVVEVVVQLRLQARLVAALPAPARAALPPHPRRPWLAFLGSPRFQLAFWRLFRRDLPGEPEAIAALKRDMRASVRRALIWMATGGVTAAALFASGWRPPWP